MEQLTLHIEKQQKKWLDILNSRYSSDGGTSLVDYAEGRLTAYTELLAYLNKETTHDRTTEETRRSRKTARQRAND